MEFRARNGCSSVWLCLFSFAEYLAACCEDEGEENPP